MIFQHFIRCTIITTLMVLAVTSSAVIINNADADGLDHVIQTGTLRHLGIPYAQFITQEHEGLDVELMQKFAKHLGVKYQFVESTWQTIISDLTGKKVKVSGDNINIIGNSPVKGDIIASGFTVLPWRIKIIDFSARTFPSGIWLIARSDAPINPIKPTGNILKDIEKVKKEMSGISVLCLEESCLDPALYGIEETGARIQHFPVDRDLSEMISSIVAKITDTTLMDVPVALVALEKWPGKIKVIGPISETQDMACAFSKDSIQLKREFDLFFEKFKQSGEYRQLVQEYYPSVFTYYPNFLKLN